MKLADVLATPAAFRRWLHIECNGEPRSYDAVLNDWQRTDIETFDAGWMRIIGRPFETNRKAWFRGYLERGRGHSKTTDLAVQAAYALAAAPRLIKGTWAAADRDQAALAIDQIEMLCRLNPVLKQLLEVQNWLVLNRQTGSVLEVVASDAPSAYGKLREFILLDEVCHWSNQEFLNVLVSTAGKQLTMLQCISNAGLGKGTSWQWNFREICRTSPNWYFHSLDGPQASWITPEVLEEQRRLLPPLAYQRVWLNQWVNETGDFLSWEDIQRSITLGHPTEKAEDGWTYVIGFDGSVSHDLTAIVVLGVQRGSPRIRVCDCRAFVPPKGGKINFANVLRVILELCYKFRPVGVYYDPFQMVSTAQELTRAGINMVEMPTTPKLLNEMAVNLLDVFSSGMIDMFEDKGLISDLTQLVIVDKGHTFTIKAGRDKATGSHADRAYAMLYALGPAMKLAHFNGQWSGRSAPRAIHQNWEPRFGIQLDLHNQFISEN